MKVYVPKQIQAIVPLSNFNLGETTQKSINVGTLNPFFHRRVYPRDRFRISPRIMLRSNPLQVDLMGTFRVHVETFFEPLKNLYGAFDNNHRVPRDMKLWTCTPQHNYSSSNTVDTTLCGGYGFVGVNSVSEQMLFPCGTFLQRLPFRKMVADVDTPAYPVNVEPIFSYLDIVRTYYRTELEPDVPYINSGGITGSNPLTVDAEELDKFFLQIRGNIVGQEFGKIPRSTFFGKFGGQTLSNWWFYAMNSGSLTATSVQPTCAGIFLRPYQRDIFSSILASSTFNSVVAPVSTPINQAQGSVKATDIITAMKVENFAALHDYSNGRFATFISDLFNLRKPVETDRPRLVDVQSFLIDINTLKTLADTEDRPAGSAVGFVLTEETLKPFYFRSGTNHGHLVTIVSISPVFGYSSGVHLGTFKDSFDDLYNPALDGLPPQPLPIMYYTAYDINTGIPSGTSPFDGGIGFSPAFVDDMTSVNYIKGQFSLGQPLESWAVNRKTFNQPAPTSNFNPYLTHYVNPADYNYMFGDTAATALNFYTVLSLDISAKRAKSKYIQSTL